MIENAIRDIGGVGLYGVISICLFVGVFLGALIRVARLKKGYLDRMRELPLQDAFETSAPAQQTDHSKDYHG